MTDEFLPFPLPQGAPPVLTFPAPAPPGDRFDRMATEQVDVDRMASDLARQRSPMSRGTSDYRVRLDATRIAHQARSWDELAALVRRQLQSHSITGPEDAKLLIDTATSAYGAERGDTDTAWYYGFALQKEYDGQQAAARKAQIDVRAAALRADPILRARLQWEDRVQQLADDAGLDYEFVAEFVKEFDRLSMPRLPGVVDPRSLPMFQVEAELAGIAYALKEYVYPLIPGGSVVSGAIGLYEGVTGEDILTGRRLATWERILNIATAILPFAGRVVKGGAKMAVKGIKTVIKVLAAGIARGAKAMAGLAREIGVGIRNMLRFIGKLGRLPYDKVQALLDRVAAARQARQSLRLASDELRLAGQVDDAMKELTAGARPGSRTASGVIEDGRALSRSQSGTIAAKPPPKPAAAAGAKAAKVLSRAAKSLVDVGYLPQAIEALEKLGIKVTGRVAESLKALGTTGRDFVNLFHQSKGFHRVVGDLVKGGNKEIGAEFVMRFATTHPDILAKVRANPLLVAFEWGMGIKKTRKFGDIFAREIDIVVRGDAAIGEADTIYHELKSWTEKSLRASRGKKLPRQIVRDTALLDPHNIRWVFNARKIADKKKIIDTFIEIISRDAYLTKAWGTDRAVIEAALDRVVVVF